MASPSLTRTRDVQEAKQLLLTSSATPHPSSVIPSSSSSSSSSSSQASGPHKDTCTISFPETLRSPPPKCGIADDDCGGDGEGEGGDGEGEEMAERGKSGYWWHVNKGGFPVPKDTWEKMWRHVVSVHPSGKVIAESIRGKAHKKVPIPNVPNMGLGSLQQRLVAVQTYLQELQYNHTGTQFFEVNKTRPLSRLMETAKEILHESLPINVQRFAIGFKSKYGDLYYRHIVLGIHLGGCYGALGLSRREDLMYKQLSYKSLFELIQDFLQAYEKYQHRVVKLKLSNPIVHDVHSCEQIQWKFVGLSLEHLSEDNLKKALDKFSRTIRTSS